MTIALATLVAVVLVSIAAFAVLAALWTVTG